MPASEDNMFFETMDVFTIFTVYINFQIMAESSDDLIFFTVERRQVHLSLLLCHLIRVQDELFSTFRIDFGWPELPLFSKMAAPMNS